MHELKDIFSSLLSEFGREIGTTELVFDKDDLCHLRIDGVLPVTIRRDRRRHRLILLGLIAERLPANLGQGMTEDLLAMGLGSLGDVGASIGLERSTGMLLLHRCLIAEELDLPRFRTVLSEFIELQKSWSGRLGLVDK